MSGREERHRGILFVLSAPSGAGKTTAAGRLLEKVGGLRLSTSHTTRPMRAGEKDGKDYYFISRGTFERMIAEGDFIEWANVHGNLYGTSWGNIRKIVEQDGDDLLLDIDTQGAAALREKDVNLVTIFFLPPSLGELERRLSSRGSESLEDLRLRLENARAEMKSVSEYDYAVVNDDLDKAVEELAAIVTAERLKVKNRSPRTLSVDSEASDAERKDF